MGYSEKRLAMPAVQCRHTAKSTGERCKRMVVGTTLCAKHGGNREDIQDKAQTMTTLATLLDADPRPWPEALAEIVHDFHSLYRSERTQARSELDSGGAVTPETVTRWVDSGRLAASTIIAAERLGIADKALQLSQQRVSVETRAIVHVVETVTSPLLDWLHRAGLASPEQARDEALATAERTYGPDSPEVRRERNHSIEYYTQRSPLRQLQTFIALAVRAAIQDVPDDEDDANQRPTLPPHLDDLVLVRRAELTALRDAAARGQSRPALDAEAATPADVRQLEAGLDALSDVDPTPAEPSAPASHDESTVVEPDEIIPRGAPSTAERHRRAAHAAVIGSSLFGSRMSHHSRRPPPT